MTERGPGEVPKGEKLLAIIAGSLQAKEVESALRESEPFVRSDFINLLRKRLRYFRRLDRELGAREKKPLLDILQGEFNVTISRGELNQPHLIIARACREGKYLDPSKMQKLLQFSLPSGLHGLLEAWQAHVIEYGNESIAHLCLDRRLFFNLCGTVSLTNGRNTEEVAIKTIGQLDNLAGRILSDPSLDVAFLNSDGREINYDNPMLYAKRIMTKIAEWKKIPEGN